jgi:hypothetical protein
MKLGIIIGVVIGIVLLAAVALFVLLHTTTQAVIQTPSTPSTAAAITTASPGPSVTQPATLNPGGTVNFSANILSVTGSDLTSRTLNAQLANTGTGDAHHVSARVDITSQGSTIKLNDGQDFLTQSLGTLKAGDSVDLEQIITVGIIDGIKIFRNGAAITLTITSDERIQSVTYNYQP